jgi:hypothetical protein
MRMRTWMWRVMVSGSCLCLVAFFRRAAQRFLLRSRACSLRIAHLDLFSSSPANDCSCPHLQPLISTRWTLTRRRSRRGCASDGCTLRRIIVIGVYLYLTGEVPLLCSAHRDMAKLHQCRVDIVHPLQRLGQTGGAQHHYQGTVRHRCLGTALRHHRPRARWMEWMSI